MPKTLYVDVFVQLEMILGMERNTSTNNKRHLWTKEYGSKHPS